MKPMKKRILSLFTAVVMVFSSVTLFSLPASAAAGPNPVLGFAINKVLDLGYRTVAKAINKSLTAVGKTADDEGVIKVASMINTILMGGQGKKLGEITALCKEILAEIEELKNDMNTSFAIVEKMLGEEKAATAKNKQDEKWQDDVDGVIDTYHARQAIDRYLVYMEAAVDYANDKSNTDLEKRYESEKENLIDCYRLMYSDTIDLDDMDNLQDILFTNTDIDDSFINLVSELSANFVKKNSSTITLAETAAQTADSYLPFSHQQYEFVHTVIGEQLMEFSNCVLTAIEFFDMQGQYILDNYGEDSSLYKGYVKVVEQFYDVLSNNTSSCALSRISEMLDAKMVIGNNTSKSLSDYMLPEDAISTNLKINNYETQKTYITYIQQSHIETHLNKKYINETVAFNRVMANDTVYYIIDPAQYSNQLALSTSALEYKEDIGAGGDIHYTSMDYLNLIKQMTDGKNNFKITNSSDTNAYDNLINTNSFALAGNVPKTYLQDYLSATSYDTYLLTSDYENYNIASMFSTKYANIWLIKANNAFSKMHLESEKVSAEYLQPDHDGDNKRYSVILANQSNVYNQSLGLKTSEFGLSYAKLTIDDGNNTTIASGETKTLTSGNKLSINFKLNEGYKVSSIKCIRNSSNGDITTEIIGTEEFEILAPNEDGSYTVNYTVPYSASQIVIETEVDHYNNGFSVDGQYQAAELNADGYYEIENAGQLFWFAALVNGDKTHADFEKQNDEANGMLVADIDLENREWTPFVHYCGTFDGKNHTISNLKIDRDDDNSGFCGYLVGGDIINLTLKGEMIVYSDRDYCGGVVGKAWAGNISRVVSDVDITIAQSSNNHYIGGVAGWTNSCQFINCGYIGTIDVTGSNYYMVGGMIGYSNSDWAIKNCYVSGNIKVSGQGSDVGVFAGYTFSYIYDGYYLGDSSLPSIGKINMMPWVELTETTAEQFKSGEVAFLLNNKTTNSSVSWRQNLDNGETPDESPMITGGMVYSRDGIYSNYLNAADVPHNSTVQKAFPRDYEGRLVIESYEDLEKLAGLVRDDYENYGSESYVLGGNIRVDADSEWTQGIGSVDGKEFNGEFDGDGYGIIGLNINSPKYGGLFEAVGEKGYIHDLLVFDCDFAVSSEVAAGGIAAVNNGKIEHCISGVDLPTESKEIDVSNLNSHIDGKLSGGIAGENNGFVTGCNSNAVINGKICGGIVGNNIGKIYGCANKTSVGDSSSETVGGLAGTNSGTIESSYNSALIDAADNKGSVAGINSGDNAVVKNVFYRAPSAAEGLGKNSTVKLDDTNKAMAELSQFTENSFTEELKKVSDDSVEWIPGDKNGPMIKCCFYEYGVQSIGYGIAVSGTMHESVNISCDLCDEGDTEYKQLAEQISDKEIRDIYALSIADNNKSFIPSELWVIGDMEVSVAVDSDDVKLAALDDETGIVYYEPDFVDNGIATFTISYPKTFAVVSDVDPSESTPAETTPAETTPVETTPAETTPVDTTTEESPAPGTSTDNSGSDENPNSGFGFGEGMVIVMVISATAIIASVTISAKKYKSKK